LDALDTEHAGAFLASVPSWAAAPVLAEMVPFRAARCLAVASEETQANIVRRLGIQQGSAVLRHLDAASRVRLLAGLPTGRSVALRLMLGYPDDTVGAWVDPEVMTVSQNAPVNDTLERVRDAESEPGAILYVLGEDRRLLGTVNIARLLRSVPAQPLAQIMDKPPHTFPAQSSLASVRAHSSWGHRPSIPVVEGGDRFVGVLHHTALRRAFETPPETGANPAMDDTLAVIGTLYWQGVAGLIQYAVSLLPVSEGNRADQRRSP